MELIRLIGNLKTHEMKRKAREEKAPQKKKTLTFKSTHTISDDEIDDQKIDEDFYPFLWKILEACTTKPNLTTEVDGKKKGKDSLLQFSEAQACHCQLPGYKEQTLYL